MGLTEAKRSSERLPTPTSTYTTSSQSSSEVSSYNPNKIARVMHKIRSQIRHCTDALVDESFFTWDRDTQQIVSNREIDGWHFVFDMDGNEIPGQETMH